MSNINDEFAMAATQFAKEEESRNQQRTDGNSGNYETVKWTGLEPKKMKVIRALGGVPDKADKLPTDARSMQLAWIKGDDGKMFRSILPVRTNDTDHVIWRVIAKVKETAYVNKKRVFVNELKHPDIYNIVAYNNVAEEQRRFNRGWEGKHVLIMNVLDRENMDWHRENKHTMLLSRNVGLSKDGTREYPEEGVPMYGLYNLIVNNCFSNYGDWNNYDLGITRTGELTNPYKLCNATAYKLGNIPEIPADVVPLVSTGPLTEEELSWERYNLDKIFQPTTYTKYYNKLKATIAMIDARFGTKFLDELQWEVEKEKEAREAAQAEKEAQDGVTTPAVVTEPAITSTPTSTESVAPAITPTPIVETVALVSTPEPVREAVPARTVAPISTGVENLDKIPFLASISPEQQATITSVALDNTGAVASITSSDPSAMVGCPSCRFVSPESFPSCINCGISFV